MKIEQDYVTPWSYEKIKAVQKLADDEGIKAHGCVMTGRWYFETDEDQFKFTVLYL